MTYSKRYAGGFVDSPSTASPIDSTFLNAVETALVALFGVVPTTNGSLIWNGSAFTSANLIANAQIDPAAAIAKTKLAALNIGNADVAGAAAIARSKLDFGSGLVNADIATAAAIAISKVAVGGNVGQVVKGDGTVALPATYRKITTKTVNTTVAATDLLNAEITIAAGALGATGGLRLTAHGDWMNNSGGPVVPPRFQLTFGGTTFIDTGAVAVTLASGATRCTWTVDAVIQNLTSGSQIVRWLSVVNAAGGVSGFSGGTNIGATTGTGTFEINSNPAASLRGAAHNTGLAVDTTASKALALNVINGSANAAYETRLFGALVEIA